MFVWIPQKRQQNVIYEWSVVQHASARPLRRPYCCRSNQHPNLINHSHTLSECFLHHWFTHSFRQFVVNVVCCWFAVYEKSVVPWAPDSDVNLCTACGKSFTITRRRHHCRLCGGIICNRCSQFLPFSYASELAVNWFLYLSIQNKFCKVH